MKVKLAGEFDFKSEMPGWNDAVEIEQEVTEITRIRAGVFNS